MSEEEIVRRLTLPVELCEAQSKLAVRLGVPIEDAVLCLALLAEFRGLPLLTTARWILEDDHDHDGVRPVLDESTVSILRWHLDSSCGPLDRLGERAGRPPGWLPGRSDAPQTVSDASGVGFDRGR